MEEIWKDIAGYEGMYQVSNLGRVKSLRRFSYRVITPERILKACIGKRGYWEVSLSKNKCGSTKTIHRLIANAFIPNPDKKPHINHINGVKTDNRIENLEWCTHDENIKHAFKIGLANNTGENNGMCILKEQNVIDIKNMLKYADVTLTEIANMYNVSLTSIYDIKSRRTWKHVEV